MLIKLSFLLAIRFEGAAEIKNPKPSPKGVSKAIKLAQEFSKEHTKGLKFSGAGDDCAGYPTTKLESSDAVFEIEPEHLKCFEFMLKGKALSEIAKKGVMSKSDAKDIALKAIKNLHTDFDKRKMVFTVEKEDSTIGVTKDGKEIKYPPTIYLFWWTEHVKIGKYDVAVPGNSVSMIVNTEKHIIIMLRSHFKVNLKNISPKPITVDEAEAKNIALTYLKSKFNFAMDKITIKGPSLYSQGKIKGPPPLPPVEIEKTPLSIYWQITAEGWQPAQGIKVKMGAWLDIDATTGQVFKFSSNY